MEAIDLASFLQSEDNQSEYSAIRTEFLPKQETEVKWSNNENCWNRMKLLQE